MNGAITSKRKFPAYTTAQLESFVADIKANETGSDACMRMIASQPHRKSLPRGQYTGRKRDQ